MFTIEIKIYLYSFIAMHATARNDYMVIASSMKTIKDKWTI